MKSVIYSMFKSLTANRVSKARVAKKTRPTLLRMESLEERQLLSVTNLTFSDGADATSRLEFDGSATVWKRGIDEIANVDALVLLQDETGKAALALSGETSGENAALWRFQEADAANFWTQTAGVVDNKATELTWVSDGETSIRDFKIDVGTDADGDGTLSAGEVEKTIGVSVQWAKVTICVDQPIEKNDAPISIKYDGPTSVTPIPTLDSIMNGLSAEIGHAYYDIRCADALASVAQIGDLADYVNNPWGYTSSEIDDAPYEIMATGNFKGRGLFCVDRGVSDVYQTFTISKTTDLVNLLKFTQNMEENPGTYRLMDDASSESFQCTNVAMNALEAAGVSLGLTEKQETTVSLPSGLANLLTQINTWAPSALDSFPFLQGKVQARDFSVPYKGFSPGYVGEYLRANGGTNGRYVATDEPESSTAFTLYAGNVGVDSVALLWNGSGAETYSVEYRRADASWSDAKPVSVSHSYATITGLDADSEYVFRVKNGATVSNEISVKTVATDDEPEPLRPSIALANVVATVDLADAQPGYKVADVVVENMDGDVVYSVTVDGEASADFVVKDGALFLNAELAAGTYSNIVVVATDGTNNVATDGFNLTIATDDEPEPLRPSITLANVVATVDLADAQPGYKVADVVVEHMDGDVVYSVTVDGETSADFVVKDGALLLNAELAAGTYSNIVVAATDGTNNVATDGFNLTVATEEEPEPLRPSITLANVVATVDLADAQPGYKVADVVVENMDGDVVYSVTVDGEASADFVVKDGALFLNAELAAGTYSNIVVAATDGTNNVYSEAVTISVESDPEVLNVPEWNLADYAGYDEFVLDATTDANVTATLYGKNADGELDVLKAWDFVGAEAVATIVGRTNVAESLTIAAGAATLLAEISFDGGDGRKDSVAIAGTDADDAFALGTESVETTTPVYQNNPYEKLLQRYADIYGENSPIYRRLKAVYDGALETLQKYVVVKTATNGVVGIENGAQIKFGGVGDVAINAGDGDDRFAVETLNFDYVFRGGEGNDVLDFAQVDGALNINMGSTARQAAVAGDGGTLRLVGDVESVVGTRKNDRFIGAGDGSSFVGNGGSDVVTILGGENNVDLRGARQSVVVRGGTANIAIADGDYSVVNVSGNARTGAFVAADGDRISIVAVGANVAANIDGDFASVLAGTAATAQINVVGSNANVITGAGDDFVAVVGNRATINVGAGDDTVRLAGAFSNVFLGYGDDFAEVADNDSGSVGSNTVMADAGDDAIVALNASGLNRFNAGLGNDVVLGGTGTDYIYGVAGNNVLIGGDGADYVYGGLGRDALAGSQTSKLAEKLNEMGARALYGEIYENWVEDGDLDATIELLGEKVVADGDRDWIYRGAGIGNLVYASRRDGDVTNALEIFPFDDELRRD